MPKNEKCYIVTLDNGNEWGVFAFTKNSAVSRWSRAVVGIRYTTPQEREWFESERATVANANPNAADDEKNRHMWFVNTPHARARVQ